LTLPVRTGNPPRPARVRVLGNPNLLRSAFSSSDPALNYRVSLNLKRFGFNFIDPKLYQKLYRHYYKDYYNYINIPLITGASYKIYPRVGLSVKRAGKLGGPELIASTRYAGLQIIGQWNNGFTSSRGIQC
jgi:hypothetical protein